VDEEGEKSGGGGTRREGRMGEGGGVGEVGVVGRVEGGG